MKNRVKGGHYIIDFFGCDPEQINNLEFWKKELPLAAQEADMEILHSYFHEFDPQGITGFLLLSTSHISIHTWPEYNYVACDIFSCSHGDDTKKAVDYLKKKLEHDRIEKVYVKRGYIMMEHLETPIYSTGKNIQIRLKSKLAEINSTFQKIVVVDTEKFGKSLVIDDVIQTSEFDHGIYDEVLLEKIPNKIEKVLILGGGDGYVAEALYNKYGDDIDISIVELDQQVINVSRKHLNQNIFDKPNVNIIIGDAVNFLEVSKTKHIKYDLIIGDLTDNPIGGKGNVKNTKKIFNQIIDSSFDLLNIGGYLSMQGGASKVSRKYINVAKIMNEIMDKKFGNVEQKDVFIPSFGEDCAFLFSQKK